MSFFYLHVCCAKGSTIITLFGLRAGSPDVRWLSGEDCGPLSTA